jgi:hypothetical protein
MARVVDVAGIFAKKLELASVLKMAGDDFAWESR